MFGQLTYLIWLALFIGLPLAALLRWRRLLWARRRALAWVTAGSLVGGWAWDALSVKLGIWYYEPANTVGVWMLGLPLEEWLWVAGVTWLFSALTVVLAESSAEA